MTKVYCTQEGMHDYTDAERYGELVFLTRLDLNNIKHGQHNEALMGELRRGLRSFNPDEDFIMVVGSPYVACAAFLILGQQGISAVRLLRWSNKDKKYVPMYIEHRKE